MYIDRTNSFSILVRLNEIFLIALLATRVFHCQISLVVSATLNASSLWKKPLLCFTEKREFDVGGEGRKQD